MNVKEEVSLDMEVVGGLCRLTFIPWMSTGRPGSDTHPGIGFDILSETPGFKCGEKYTLGTGVINRTDAARLRDMLELFLKGHARGENL